MTSLDQLSELPDTTPRSSLPQTTASSRSVLHDNTSTFTDSELADLPPSIKVSLKRASHHASTRKQLHKYDAYRKDQKRNLGYSVLEKEGGYDDLTEIKTLAEFQTERKTMVDEVLSTVSGNFRL